MATLEFEAARKCVIDTVCARRPAISMEEVPLAQAAGRVLAQDIRADRDYPPLARSIRDGFAVRASDLPGRLHVAGEVRAGERPAARVGPGEVIEIMTGAPVPEGADAVVMVEHVTRDGSEIVCDRGAEPGQFINPQGAEARAGDVVLRAGVRLDYAHVALLATTGHERAPVFRRPRVAVLATGDEIVEPGEQPAPHQIRNSNAYSLAAQVLRAGGEPEILPVARDNRQSTRELMERGLVSDLLLISGGVSAGKYDVVEPALAELSAEFFFDRVLIQPGQPLVFGTARGTFFFGLPGNPASTMVTFELFARAALELAGGLAEPCLPVTLARLTVPFRHRPGLTRFLPACLDADGIGVTPLKWSGSSDVPALARANVFLVAEAGRESWSEGDLIGVLAK